MLYVWKSVCLRAGNDSFAWLRVDVLTAERVSCLMPHVGFLTERSAETAGKGDPGLETESAERTSKVPPVSGGT